MPGAPGIRKALAAPVLMRRCGAVLHDHLQAFVLANINMKLTPHCTEGILARCGGVVGWYVALVLSGNLRAILNQSLLVYAPADLHLQWS